MAKAHQNGARWLAPYIPIIITMANTIKTENTEEKPVRHILPPEQRRCKFLKCRATEDQAQHIKMLADACNMTVSDYLLARAYNYKPKARLSALEQKFVDNLCMARTDYRKYLSQLKLLSAQQRAELFKSESWLKGAARLLVDEANKISKTLTDVFGDNPLPPCTSNSSKKQK